MHERMNTPFLSFPEEFDVSTKTGNDFGAFGVKKMRIQRKNSFSPSSFSFSLFSLFLSPGGKIFEVGRMGRRDGGRWLGQVKKDPALSQSGRLLRFLSMQRVIWPVAVAGQARPGRFHQGDFVTLPRRNKSCSSCIKFVGSAVKLLVYAATLLINREEAEGMANGKTPGYSRCSRLRQPLPSPPLVPLLIDAENPARVLDSPGEFFPHPSSPFSRPRPNIRRLSPFRHLFEKNLNLESEKAAG